MKNSKSKNTGPMTLYDLFVIKLQSLYDTENVIIKALPKMATNATDSELKVALETHIRETEEHVRRLERIFETLGERAKRTQVEGIRGIVTDAEWAIKNIESGSTLDAALIASAQYAEHYEIAGYGTAREWASLMEYADIEETLRKTLEEEKNADVTLNSIAINRVNVKANDEDEENSDDEDDDL